MVDLGPTFKRTIPGLVDGYQEEEWERAVGDTGASLTTTPTSVVVPARSRRLPEG